MVRRVRFSPDDSAHFDPRDRRDTFDDLDDLVMDATPGSEKSPAGKPADNPKSAPAKRRNTKDERRHLADADWLAEPKSGGE